MHFFVLCVSAPAMVLAQDGTHQSGSRRDLPHTSTTQHAFAQNTGHVVILNIRHACHRTDLLVVEFVDSRRFKSTVPISMVFGAAFCVVLKLLTTIWRRCL